MTQIILKRCPECQRLKIFGQWLNPHHRGSHRLIKNIEAQLEEHAEAIIFEDERCDRCQVDK